MYDTVEKGRGGLPLKRGCLAGLGGAALTLLLLLGCALAVNGGLLPAGRGQLYGRVALAVAALCAGVIACGKQSGRRGGNALLCGGILLLFLLLLGCAGEGSSLINMSLGVNALCVISGVFIAWLFTGKRKRRRRKH